MKTEKNILVAFLLNISFSLFELFGGLFTGSVAILSDAIHDLGDAISIGLSYGLEKKSKKKPDNQYTYGYIRYSIIGAFITITILIVGSVVVIYGAIKRLVFPVEINYDGMIWFAVFGTTINFLAAYFTREGDSLNQKAVNLHMMEDVLGWVVVLIGAILMKFTNIARIDSVMSIGVALFIFVHATSNFKNILDLFLEKIPKEISIEEIQEHLLKIKEVFDIHHMHVWSIDGVNHYGTLHVVTDAKDTEKVKKVIREELAEHGIGHVTIELESKEANCREKVCQPKTNIEVGHHHHH